MNPTELHGISHTGDLIDFFYPTYNYKVEDLFGHFSVLACDAHAFFILFREPIYVADLFHTGHPHMPIGPLFQLYTTGIYPAHTHAFCFFTFHLISSHLRIALPNGLFVSFSNKMLCVQHISPFFALI
jgi:hypothetical protein